MDHNKPQNKHNTNTANTLMTNVAESLRMTIRRYQMPPEISFNFDLETIPMITNCRPEYVRPLTKAVLKALALLVGGHNDIHGVTHPPEIPDVVQLKFDYASGKLVLKALNSLPS